MVVLDCRGFGVCVVLLGSVGSAGSLNLGDNRLWDVGSVGSADLLFLGVRHFEVSEAVSGGVALSGWD